MINLSSKINLLIFGYLLVYIYSYKIVNVSVNSLPENYSDIMTSSLSFNVSINNTLNFDYLTIKVLNKLSNYLGQTIFLSYSDIDCQLERSQMSFSPYQDSVMILNMAEIKAKKNAYICVQCLEEKNCKYVFGYDQNYIQRFPMADISYSYYASKNYMNMNFGIRAEDKIFDLFKEAQDYYEIFWIKRLYNNEFINYYDNSKIHEDFNAVLLLKNITKAKRYIDFNVSSKEGEFIQVGSSLISYYNGYYNKYYYDIKPLNINDIQSIGRLQKPNISEVCYKLNSNYYYQSTNLFYIYGVVQEKFAKTYFRDYYRRDKIISTEKQIIDGNIIEIINNNQFSNLFCVSILESDKYNIPNYITFSIQLITHKLIKPYYFFIPPQKPETIYPRIIQNGEYIILSRVKPPEKSSIMSFTINSIYGNPEIKYHQCMQFPFCSYQDYLIKTLPIIKSNKMNNYNDIWMYESVFDAYQPLFFLICPDTTEYCLFDTTFFSKNDKIILKEGKIFSQLLLASHKNIFIAEFGEHKNLLKIILELIIFGGDAKLKIFNKNLNITNYFLLNKKIYLINSNELNEKKIEFEIDSNKKSFYSIRYTVIRNDESNRMNLMDTIGINYIDYIDNDYKYKNIEVQNSKYNKSFPLLINYYSPNCKFQIKKNNTNLDTYLYNNFYQEYIPSNSSINYNYNISIKEYEPINNKDKKCKLFSNSFKITNENSEKIGTLLINENIPLVYNFKEIYKIRYIYPNYDSGKETLINLKLLNNKKYLINITCNYNNLILLKNITKSEIISIEKNTITNLEDESNLIIEINLLDFSTDTIPILKTVVHQIKNKFMYLEKGMYKKDLLSNNNNLYLYTDIYENNEGYIKLDLVKEKVKIKGKIIKMDEIDISEEINWDSIKTENEKDLKFDFYTKKIYFTEKETSICSSGCYLLINIEPPVNKDFSREIRFFPVNIMAILTKKNISNSYKIKFEPDEIIVGTFFNNYYENNKMSELYQLNIPYNAESIDIECHSKTSKLLIFLEDEPISYEKSSFTVEPGQLLNIPKKNISALNSNYKDLENIKIIICAYAEKIYWTDISYTFKVHLNKKDNFKIKKIISDQKTLCHPESFEENKYRCLFMIDFSQFTPNNYLILYAKSKSDNVKMYMKGGYLENNTIYDMFDIESLKNAIPNKNAKFDTENNDINYILLPPNKEDKYFYLNVLSNSPSEIELISNFYNFNDDFIPNPNLIQLFSLKNSPKDELKLNFISINSIMINAVLLKGEGEIKYNNKVFNLDKKNNQILFPQNSNVDLNIIFKAKDIEEDTLLSSEKEEDFVFFIEYYFINSTLNIDEINFGDNTIFHYKNSDYPLYLYSSLGNKQIEHDINIFFNIYNLSSNTQEIKYIKNKELDILSLFFEEKEKGNIFNKTETKDLSNIIGTYDPSINVGQIYIPKDFVNNIISSNYEKPTFLLAFEKNEKNDNIYNEINMKINYIKVNSEILIDENKYIFGKLYENNYKNIYKLKVDDNAEYIMIQFSANSEIVNYTISIGDNEEAKDIFENYIIKKEKGKTITTFKRPNNIEYLYLNIYENNNTNISKKNYEKLKNYVFKYKNIFDEKKLNEYPILNGNNKLKCTITERKGERLIQLSYNKIENDSNYEIIYSLKLVNKKDYIEGESSDTIAITESNSFIIKFKTNKDNIKNNTMDIPLDFFDDNFTYIQLIAQIIDGDNVDYFSYQSITSMKEIIFKYDEKNKNNFWPIILIIIIVLISIISTVLVIRYKKKNKKVEEEEILNQVEMANPIEYDDVLLDKSTDIN